MTASGWLQVGLLLVVLTAITPLLGGYIHRVFSGERVLLTRLLGPVERRLSALLAGPEPAAQEWKGYAGSVLMFSAVCWLALFLILRTQSIQPLNPQGFRSAPWDLSFNTASSFVSNTGWQFYGGERTRSTQKLPNSLPARLANPRAIATPAAIPTAPLRKPWTAIPAIWAKFESCLLYTSPSPRD